MLITQNDLQSSHLNARSDDFHNTASLSSSHPTLAISLPARQSSRPIRGQYSGHVFTLDQSEPSIRHVRALRALFLRGWSDNFCGIVNVTRSFTYMVQYNVNVLVTFMVYNDNALIMILRTLFICAPPKVRHNPMSEAHKATFTYYVVLCWQLFWFL